MRERLLDHLAEGEAGEKLHLRADRHADHIGRLTTHRRQHELAAHVPVDVDLLVVQAGEDFLGHARSVPEVALHRVEDEGRRVIGRGDVLHDFAEGVERPLQLVRVVEVLAAGDALGFLRPLGQIQHVHAGRGLETGLLGCLPFRQPLGQFLGLQRAPLRGHARHDPDQEGVREEVVIHLDVDVLLHDLVAVLTQHRCQAGQRQVGRRRHPLRWEQEHRLQLPAAHALLESWLLDLHDAVCHRIPLRPRRR